VDEVDIDEPPLENGNRNASIFYCTQCI